MSGCKRYFFLITSAALPLITSRRQACTEAGFTLFPYDFSDAMEESPVPRVSWGLVMDKFDLER